MPNEESLSGLTRSLLLGVSLGTIGITQVGCAPEGATLTAASQTVQPGAIAVGTEDERLLCLRVFRSRAVADVNLLLTQFPASRCIAPLLSSLPARTLAGLSPEAVSGVAPEVLAALPPDVAARLPVLPQSRSVVVRTSAEDLRY